MTTMIACRRSNPRHQVDGEQVASVEFHYPDPDGTALTMQLRDFSASGFSFVLDRELPGLEVGRSIDGVTVRVNERVLSGDLLVMHLTPDNDSGSVCGALFYPHTDDDILALQALVAESTEEVPVR